MRRLLRLATLCVVACCALPATAKPGLAELRGEAMKRVRASDTVSSTLGGLAPLPGTKDAASEFLADLFQDQGFIAATRAWLDTTKATSSEGVYLDWARQYAATIDTGVNLLSDDELGTLVHLAALRVLDGPPDACERRTSDDPGRREAMPPYTAAELADYFRVLKRAYLGALANEKPRPPPSEDVLANAVIEMMTKLAPPDRQRLLHISLHMPKTFGPENCNDMKTIQGAIEAVPGEPGAVLLRVYRLSVAHAIFDPSPAPETEPELKGVESGGAFTPGEAKLMYPALATRMGVTGTMVLRVWVDGNGRAQRLKTVTHDFHPATVALDDGTEVPSHELFEPTVAAFYQSGRFQRRFKDGKPEAYTADIPLRWTLE